MAIKRTRTGYQIRWYDADGRERKQCFKGFTRDQAEVKERELLLRRDHGEPVPDRRSIPTFDAFSKTWIEERRAGWKSSTLAQYEQILKSQLRPAFGELRMNHIAESRALQFRTALQDAGLSSRRINLILLVLKMIVRAARQRKWIREDPLSEVKKLREEKADVDPLGPHEVDSFLKACPIWWRPYFCVAFWTGARPNELAALKWGNVDWAGGTFRIRAGRYRGVESTPKTASSSRDVDMLPPAIEALRAQRAQQARARLADGQSATEHSSDYVFTGPEGGLFNINFLRERIWYPSLDRAKLRRRKFYQTRHTFASNALAAGENPAWVSRMLGHTSPEMLFRVYARYIPNRTRSDGSALLIRMERETEVKKGPESACYTTKIRPI